MFQNPQQSEATHHQKNKSIKIYTWAIHKYHSFSTTHTLKLLGTCNLITRIKQSNTQERLVPRMLKGYI